MNKAVCISIILSDWHDLRAGLLTEDGKENAAVLLCGVSYAESERRLLVRRIISVPKEEYEIREHLHLRVSPTFYNEVVNQCLESNLSPVIVHSHPFSGEARYSPSDDYGESNLLPVLSSLLPDAFPASLLITQTDVSGRFLDDSAFSKISSLRIVGPKSQIIGFGKQPLPFVNERHDRQVRAFGEQGQSEIQRLKIAVVGIGGIGSLVAEQLGRLGISDLLLIDDDVIEESNLSRLVGSTFEDVGKNKADVIADHIRSLGGDKVKSITDSALRQDVLMHLRDRDLIFGCVDNDRTRAMLNRFAHQYLTPVIDMGTRIDAREGKITNAAGRVTVVAPGMTCLRCSHHLNAERIRAESMTKEERVRLVKEGYVMGIDDPAPSVISINTVIAGLAVTTGLNLFINLTGATNITSQLYDATSGFVFTAEPVHVRGCDICDPTEGVKALGDLQIVSAY